MLSFFVVALVIGVTVCILLQVLGMLQLTHAELSGRPELRAPPDQLAEAR